MTTTINRHTIIREVVEEHGLVDPRDIAAIVEQRTPDDMIRAWYREAILPDIRNEHLRRRKQSSQSKVATAIARAEKEGQTISSRTRANLVSDAWSSKIAAGVSVGGEWKRLADCDAAEVLALAEARYAAADAVSREGDRFKSLSAAMDEHGVSVVGDLPADVGLAIL